MAEIERERSAQEILKLEWDYPVYVSANAADQRLDRQATGTYAKSRRAALPREDAFAYIIRDDPRPLLVMRECDWCKDSDDALLSTRMDNEKTMLMSSWFHMVKLTNDVLQEDHPFRNVFGDRSPPHLFVAMPDGSEPIELSGQQSQSELWNAMLEMLDRNYDGNADRAVKKMYRLLDTFDELDREESRLLMRMDDELESKGPKSSKLKKMKKSLDKLEREREEAETDFQDLLDLGLKAAD